MFDFFPGREEREEQFLIVLTKSRYWTRTGLGVFSLPCQSVGGAAFVVQTVVIVDSIINCMLGSFKVHWVTGRLQAGQLKRCWECYSLSHA